jgi:hypothetical protein
MPGAWVWPWAFGNSGCGVVDGVGSAVEVGATVGVTLGVELAVGLVIGSGYGVIVEAGSTMRVLKTTPVIVPAEIAKTIKRVGPMIKNNFFNILPPRPVKGSGPSISRKVVGFLSSKAHCWRPEHRRYCLTLKLRNHI